MSVICAPPGSSPMANGIQTRAAAKAPGGNVLFVKGAAECLLQRSSQVLHLPRTHLLSPLLRLPLIFSLGRHLAQQPHWGEVAICVQSNPTP